jgi:hypothetical protein
MRSGAGFVMGTVGSGCIDAVLGESIGTVLGGASGVGTSDSAGVGVCSGESAAGLTSGVIADWLLLGGAWMSIVVGGAGVTEHDQAAHREGGGPEQRSLEKSHVHRDLSREREDL